MKWTPHKYQIECVQHMLKSGASGAFLDPGEGKTSCSLAMLSVLKKEKKLKGAVVVATKNIMDMETWQNEIKKWSDFNHLTYTMLHGKNKEDNLKKKHDLYVINYEGLPWLYEQRRHIKSNVCILDESSKIKNHTTIRFKILKHLANDFDYRAILTGTPSAQSLLDLWSQIYFLDGGKRLGYYITHFRNRYFYPLITKGKVVYKYGLQEGAEEKIYKAISDIIYRTPEDTLKIPKEKYNDIYVNLPPDIMAKYIELEKDYITQIDRKVLTAVSAAAKRNKLKQFANGAVYDENRKVIHIHDMKINAAIDYVDELQGKPCLIGYEFQHDLLALRKAFPNAPYIGTDLDGKKPTAAQKREIQNLWNAGKIPVLIGQISAISHGLNIQEAGHHMLIYSHLDKLEDVIQFIRRLRRQGQKKRVIVGRIIARGTVDLDALANQLTKNLTQEKLLEAMRERHKYISKS